jgi:hypothetical protein
LAGQHCPWCLFTVRGNEEQKFHSCLSTSLTRRQLSTALWPINRIRYKQQIEFLFRDDKQFTGLSDCQARGKAALHFHFNATMTALNLIKLQDRHQVSVPEGHVISIMSWKIRKFNEHLLKRFSDMLGLDFSSIKSHPHDLKG